MGLKVLLPWAALPASTGQRDVLWAEVRLLEYRMFPGEVLNLHIPRAFAVSHLCWSLRGIFS